MFIDNDGEVFNFTDVYDGGKVIVHHHGTKTLTHDQNERISEIMTRAWDALPESTKKEINKKMELKYGKEEES